MAYPALRPLYTEEEYLAFERKADERSEYFEETVTQA